jgi:hypothetical protein
VLPGIVLALFALKSVGPVRDPDAYWHIATGEHLQRTWDFVLADPFGAATERVWILNQWLTELLMHWSHAIAGLPGVAWLLSVASVLVGLCVWRSCRRFASSLVTALVVVVTFVALSGSLSPRPQVVTFALTAVTTSAWLGTRDDGRPRWWLVPLTWIWAMSHGTWFVGPLVGFAVITGMALEHRSTLRETGRLALVPVLSLAAAAVTPVGPRLFTSPFQVSEVTAYISEWQRPGLGDPASVAALALVLVVIIEQVRGVDRRRWSTILLAVFGLALAMTYARTVGLGAVILAPLAANAIQSWTRHPAPAPERREHLAAGAIGGTALGVSAVLALMVARTPALGPNALDGALDRLPAGTVVCNDQVDGGWLMLRHPGLRPTMDTRVELYTVEHIRGYHAFMAAGQQGWHAYLSRTQCTAALLPATAPVATTLAAEPDWEPVASGDDYVLLVETP